MIIVYLFVLFVAFYLLAIVCEDFFIGSLDTISEKLKLPSDVAGATFMAMGSSAPELFTALFAIFRAGNHGDIGAGTIVGSAIFNILVIIGVSASFKRAKLTWQPVIRDTVFYVLTILLLLAVFWDGKIVLAEALLFVFCYVLYVGTVVIWKKILPYKDTNVIDIVENSQKKNKFAQASKQLIAYIIPDPNKKPKAYIVTFLLSIVALAVLSYILVEAAVGIGVILNINPTIIALTVLAAGTSIPDLISSVVVAKQGRGDMAVSNAVGSNIFDILFGLGFPWLLLFIIKGESSIAVGRDNLLSSVFLLLATVIAILFILITRNWTIGRKAGILLVLLYVAYLFYIISTTLGFFTF